MSASPASPSDPRKGVLDYIWSQYLVWDYTAVKRRASLTLWRWLVLLLGVLGALAATLSTQVAADNRNKLGILSAVFLGLAAFVSQKVISTKDEEQWVNSRAAAEAFKREAFLLATGAPPYDAAVSLEPAKAIIAGLGDLVPLSPPEGQRQTEAPPACPMNVDGYITSRVNDQARWYGRRGGEHGRTLKIIGAVIFILGALAVVLGYMGDNKAPWIAVITTVTATLTAFLFAWRYQYMVVSYNATKRRLEARLAEWVASLKTDADTAERNQFILECEGILSAENKAWITELNRKDSTASTPVSGQPTPPTQPTGGGQPNGAPGGNGGGAAGAGETEVAGAGAGGAGEQIEP
ncbi:MAG TPA: DUF4231 domain-containing protein [Pyrinomonadaceae bacterium]|nr:DUF4231 domain-containing protein [Pyrinomonadaceae bacterium]